MKAAAAILFGIILLEMVFFQRWGCLFRGAAFSAFSGMSTLLLLHFMQGSLGFCIPVTTGTLAVSGVLGIPGTILLLMGRFFVQLG